MAKETSALSYVISVKDKASKRIKKVHSRFSKVSRLYERYDRDRFTASKRERKDHRKKIKELTKEEKGVRRLIKAYRGLKKVGRGAKMAGRGAARAGMAGGRALSTGSGGLAGALGAMPFGAGALFMGAMAVRNRVDAAVQNQKSGNFHRGLISDKLGATRKKLSRKEREAIYQRQAKEKGRAFTKEETDMLMHGKRTKTGKLLQGDSTSTLDQKSDMLAQFAHFSSSTEEATENFEKLNKSAKFLGVSIDQVGKGIPAHLQKFASLEDQLETQINQQLGAISPEERLRSEIRQGELNERLQRRAGDKSRRSIQADQSHLTAVARNQEAQERLLSTKKMRESSRWTTKKENKLLQMLSKGDVSVSDVKDLFGVKREEGRAAGGQVLKNRPYVVGERRPELFMPNQNGTIKNSVPMNSQPKGNNNSTKNINVDMNVNVKIDGKNMNGQNVNEVQRAIQESLTKTFKKDVRAELGMMTEE